MRSVMRSVRGGPICPWACRFPFGPRLGPATRRRLREVGPRLRILTTALANSQTSVFRGGGFALTPGVGNVRSEAGPTHICVVDLRIFLVVRGMRERQRFQPANYQCFRFGNRAGRARSDLGAHLKLYRAGFSGNGTGAKVIASAKSNSTGQFTLRYRAPKDTVLLYIEATGGDAGAGQNSAIGLMAVAGMSDSLPPSVIINELSTIAAEFELAQFTDASGKIIGSSATNFVGVPNAVKVIQTNLVNASGTAASFWPTSAQCTGGTPPDNCEGLERMNALANLLAACVLTNGPSSSACSTLLQATGASDTLQAAHAIATKPANQAAQLFALAQTTSVFTPAIAQAPDAWTIALKYVGNGHEFDGPANIAFDSMGNAWISNNYVYQSDHSLPTCGGMQVLELTPTGSDAPNAPFSGGGVNGAGFGIALDQDENVWVGNFGFAGEGCATPPSGTTSSFFTPSGSAISPAGGYTQGNLGGPQGLALDLDGGVWFANFNNNTITMYPDGDPDAAINLSNLGIMNPFGIAADANGNVWAGAWGDHKLVKLTPNGSTIDSVVYTGGGLSKPLGLTIDMNGNIWLANSLGDTVSMFHSDGTPDPNSPFHGGGIALPWGVSIDGNNNVWVANFSGDHPTLSELCGATVGNCPNGLNTGDPITPSTGYTSSLLQRQTAAVADASGNVWCADNWMLQPQMSNPGGNGMVVYLGLAGPVKVPMLGPVQKP